MKNKDNYILLISIILLITLIISLGSLTKEKNNNGTDEKILKTIPPQINSSNYTGIIYEWLYITSLDEGYRNSYETLLLVEESFKGILNYNSCELSNKSYSTLMRCLPYDIDGTKVYLGNLDLSSYVGRKVEVFGKLNTFELNGQELTEIWPERIIPI
ncbi:MAG: hypothetical protein NUV97_00125 [archaeon]|nr:hypothetical protein [archaeon]MCR4323585.1 hypothetical protein [Nanoarchaeota archaeon]